MLGRKKITYYHKLLGHLDEATGLWEQGTNETGIIIASCQPLNQNEQSQYVVPNAEGESRYSTLKLYSDTALQTSKQAESGEADRIEYMGKQYKIVDVQPFQSGIISHYKMIAVEVADDEADRFAQ